MKAAATPTGSLAIWNRRSGRIQKSAEIKDKVAPEGPKPIPKAGARSVPRFGMGFGPPGATQTPILADFRLRPDLRLQMARLPVSVAAAYYRRFFVSAVLLHTDRVHQSAP